MREGYGVGFWNAIRKDWNLVHRRISFLMGNGHKVTFWKDKWCGDNSLSVTFLSLSALAVSKFGITQLKRVGGVLASLDLSMIRRWIL